MSKTAANPLQRKLQDNIQRVRERITEACRQVDRDPQSVRIVAVTKKVEVDVIRIALELGLTDLGENRVQDLTRRASMIHESGRRKRMLGGDQPRQAPTWHMIGHLQRNKVRSVLQWSNTIHSVDSLRLAEEINAEAAKLDCTIDIFLQINVASEKSKFGLAVGAVDVVSEQIREMARLRLVGLMTIAPLVDDTATVRSVFCRLREIADHVKEKGQVGDEFRELSMGMSNDFEVAIEEGATIVRIGSSIFEDLRAPAE